MELEQLQQQVAESWNKSMPFNQLLGLTITKLDHQQSEVRFPWQDNLVGNPVAKILHGGVTASALDLVGGVVAAAHVIASQDNWTSEQLSKSLSRLSTIDLRTDFLRPGRGQEFIATARIIRGGNKVAVARMELHNELGEHIAFGTGTYMVG